MTITINSVGYAYGKASSGLLPDFDVSNFMPYSPAKKLSGIKIVVIKPTEQSYGSS